MTTFYSALSALSLLSYWLLIAAISIRVLMNRRTTSYVAAWLLIIYIIPFVGIVAYILFGELHLGRQRVNRAKQIWPSVSEWLNEIKAYKEIFADHISPVAEPLFKLCENRQGLAGIQGNQLKLFTTAESTFNQLITDINQAQNSIDIVFYIWNAGGLADNVAQAFIAAAKRGLKCRLLLDSAGSHRFFKSPWPEKMAMAGIEVVEALKVNLLRLLFRRMDLRQHRKIILIDNLITYTGSMNLVDPRYFKKNADVGQWIDIMIRVVGPISTVMATIYASDWEMETGKRLLPPTPSSTLLNPYQEGHTLQVIGSGPGFLNDMIQQSLLTAIYSARHKLVMTTPYFVPSDNLLNAICNVALRGVDVSIIQPKKNDSIMVGWASQAFFTELLEAGVKIYDYKGGLLHTKSVLIDDQLSLIGSVNLDMRSLWLNFEITTVIDDKDFGHDLAKLQQEYIDDSEQIKTEFWLKRPLWRRILERLFYFFAPLL